MSAHSQIGQQAISAKALKNFNLNVCYVPETRIQDATSIISMHSPNPTSSSRFTLRVSIDSASDGRGVAGIGIVLMPRIGAHFLTGFQLSDGRQRGASVQLVR
ncbi:unnamed protein product [Echinostoma caproni]|uniref:Uncharacterized protein n=1 Tax=Echinostoma caproni TaxID=27848 RepID=A0A183A3T2_9TREM|nr:unnamed protein product [Echinostoma caproni]